MGSPPSCRFRPAVGLWYIGAMSQQDHITAERAAATDYENEAKSNDQARTDQTYFGIVKNAVTDFLADDAMTQAAAVAFYTALSFAPLLVLTIYLIGHVLGDETANRIVNEIQTTVGTQAGQTVDLVRQQAEKQSADMNLFSAGGLIALIALIFSASGVFAQLQSALNQIWDVEQAPGGGVIGFLRKRGLSVGVIFVIIFLLLMSLTVTTVLNATISVLPGEHHFAWLWQLLNFGVSVGVYVVLFALMLKYLPDVNVPWRACWFGAAVTAVLFAVGKWGIGLYLSKSDPSSGYGGAGGSGAIVVLLVWVYYSAIIIFLGAEFTQAWAKGRGVRVTPEKHARASQTRKADAANDAANDRKMKERSGHAAK